MWILSLYNADYLKHIHSVSKIHDTNLGECSVHKNSEESICKCECSDAVSLSCGPFYFGRWNAKCKPLHRYGTCLFTIHRFQHYRLLFWKQQITAKCSVYCPCASTQHTACLIKDCCMCSKILNVLQMNLYPSSTLYYGSTISLIALAYAVLLRWPYK